MKRRLSNEQKQISPLDLECLRITQIIYAGAINNFYCLTTETIAAQLKKEKLGCITTAKQLIQNKDNFKKRNRIFVLGPVPEDLIVSLLDFPDFTDTRLILIDSQYTNVTSINNHTRAPSRTVRIMSETSTQLIPAIGYILMGCPSTLFLNLNNESLLKNNPFITLTSQTTVDTLAALPQAISSIHVVDLIPEQIKQCPKHIKGIGTFNILDPKTIAAIPPNITEIYIRNANARCMEEIPGHIIRIDLDSSITAETAAAIPQANANVNRTICIQDATKNAVSHLPKHIKTVRIKNNTPLDSIAAIPSTVTRVFVLNADATRVKEIPAHVKFIDISATTTPDAVAAIPKADPKINRIVHIQNATADAVTQLPEHIKTICINNKTPSHSIATIPATVIRIYVFDTDGAGMAHIPAHVEFIDLNVDTTPAAVAAIPEAHPEIDRIVHIQNATADAVAKLPEHIKTISINNDTPPHSIAAIPSTVNRVFIWDADTAHVEKIPGYIKQIDLSDDTTPDVVAAIPEAHPEIDRIVHIQNATADAVAQLPEHIKTIYINSDTSPESIAAIPATVTRIFIWDADATCVKKIPGHVEQINLSVDTTTDAVTAIPQANPEINRIVHLRDATADAVAHLPKHIKTVCFSDKVIAASILAIPKTVTHIQISIADNDILPTEACQNIIQLLNERPNLACTTSPSFMDHLTPSDYIYASAIATILKQGTTTHRISRFAALPKVKENLIALKKCLQENRADTLGDPSAALRTTSEISLLAYLLVCLLQQKPSVKIDTTIKQYVHLLDKQQQAFLLSAFGNTNTLIDNREKITLPPPNGNYNPMMHRQPPPSPQRLPSNQSIARESTSPFQS